MNKDVYRAFRLNKEYDKKLILRAKKEKRTISSMIRMMIEFHLDRL